MLKEPITPENFQTLYDAIRTLKEDEMTTEILVLLHSKKEIINKVIESKEKELTPSDKRKFDSLKRKFDSLFVFAEKEFKRQEEIKQAEKENAPYNDYWNKMLSAYGELDNGIYKEKTIIDARTDLDEQVKNRIKSSLDDYANILRKEKAEQIQKETFEKFTNSIADRTAKSSYDVSKEKGEKYQEFLKNFIDEIKKNRNSKIKDIISNEEKRIEIPTTTARQNIPSPLDVLKQTKPGFFNKIHRALGLEEEVVNEQTLCESLQLKKLSLKEAMEEEYD